MKRKKRASPTRAARVSRPQAASWRGRDDGIAHLHECSPSPPAQRGHTVWFGAYRAFRVPSGGRFPRLSTSRAQGAPERAGAVFRPPEREELLKLTAMNTQLSDSLRALPLFSRGFIWFRANGSHHPLLYTLFRKVSSAWE